MGTTFPSPEALPGDEVILVGGGVGIAPLRFWLQHYPVGRGRAVLVHGARSARDLFDLPEAPARVLHSSDDGSQGLHGTVLDSLEALRLEWGDERLSRACLLTCGPEPMMAAVLRAWQGRVAAPWASLEGMGSRSESGPVAAISDSGTPTRKK